MRWVGLLATCGTLLGLAGRAHGQAQQGAARLLVKLTPQYVVVGGYWLEVERSWRQHPRHSVALTPQLYAGRAGRPDALTGYPPHENQRVRGMGVQLQHRYYVDAPQNSAYPTGFYVSYGLHFQHFDMLRDETEWYQITDPTGLPRFEYGPVRYVETINRYGASVQVGYQAPLPPGPVFLDVYAGAGWRESRSREAAQTVQSRYRSGPSDYGHEGFYFPIGFKIGVALR